MNHNERNNIACAIGEKIKKNEELTQAEKDFVLACLVDPLQEFCRREGVFRLVEVLDYPEDEITEEMAEEATDIIRDDIDYSESLYDKFDYDLQDLIKEYENNKEEN